tara:strand:+ start:5603 stop:6796 length:1194 start_codon:yes stop_codon:yes gene_type:complete
MNTSKILFLEINRDNFSFFVGVNDEQNNFKMDYELNVPIEGIENKRFSDLEKALNLIKENIYLVEQKFNYTFKEVVLIIENFNPKFINLTGFKKLNGSQVVRENITYILNTLKSFIDKTESNKTVLHIFNSKFSLDNKKIENLPIGLFGDFYSHELSFTLLHSNDYKNIKNIFDKCNLKIKKILLKSFVKGALLSENNNNIENFFHLKINNKRSKIFYFENNSLKFEQNFNFGYDVIINDISKITSLKIENIKKILNTIQLKEGYSDNELIEEDFFEGTNYRKIKKKLIYEIILARVQEISEIIIFKNINFKYFNESQKVLFFEFDRNFKQQCFKETYKNVFNKNCVSDVIFLDNLPRDSLLKEANKLVHFGWKKEAIPVTQSQKTLIARFFDAIFG